MPGETLDQRVDSRLGPLGDEVARRGMHRMRNLRERQVGHASAGGLLARRRRECRAEDGDRGDAAPLEIDRISDADRGRGAAIAEALHHRVAAGERREIAVRQPVLGRGLAHDRTLNDPEAIRKRFSKVADEEIGIALAVVDEADAHAPKSRKPRRHRDDRDLLANGGLEYALHGHLRDLPLAPRGLG